MLKGHTDDTICALSTPAGMGAIALVRVTGPSALLIVDSLFIGRLFELESHKVMYGTIKDGYRIVDEVVCTVFRAPNSFTGEDVVEISCHGSNYIQQEILRLLLAAGCRMAEPGEFTMRAFFNKKMDLSQAEAVGDLIASTSAASHQLAMSQMRGGVSNELKVLRQKLLDFTSLIELELDFAEEDVEFADRTQLTNLIAEMLERIKKLLQSFSYGNAIKKGVPTAIIGLPNAGKSTLLNALLQDNRAIVSDIPGTTRDVIEDRLIIDGIEFRLQDTAGLRKTKDVIEAEGVNRSEALAKNASLLLYVFDPNEQDEVDAGMYLKQMGLPESVRIIYVANKMDTLGYDPYQKHDVMAISAKEGTGIDALRERMTREVGMFLQDRQQEVVITNARHLQELQATYDALLDVEKGLSSGVSGDLLTIDIKNALHHLGGITGEISNDEVLGNIFGKFCIGK